MAAITIGPLTSVAAQENEGASIDGSVHYELRGDAENKTIWLFPKDHKEKAVKLCDTEGWGNLQVHFSPDNFWIVIQDGGASLGVHLSLYRRDKGVIYQCVKEDIGADAEEQALQQIGKQSFGLDHRYARVLQWSADSRTILIEIRGSGSHDGTHVSVGRWVGDL